MACTYGRINGLCNDGRKATYRRGGRVRDDINRTSGIRKSRNFQRGSFRPRGMINRGSGRIDPTSSDRLPVDDVHAILGLGEFVLNANSVKLVGEKFLTQLNNLGLKDKQSSIQPDTLKYGSRYQVGGKIARKNRQKIINRRNK